jgi:hypothetical protein
MKTSAAATALLAILLAVQAQAGLQYTVKTTVEGGKRGGDAGNQSMQMTADGAKARMEFLKGGPMKAGEGYILTQDGGKTMFMVSPKEKTYMKWDMDAMMGLAGAMTSMMKMEVTDPKTEKLLDEAGAPILGYPTRHYKFRTSYGMSMTVMGFNSSSTIVREEEAWTTTKINTAALSAWLKKAPKTNNESLDKLMKQQMEKMTGLPLKTIAVQTSTDKNGKTQTSTTTMEVTEVKELKPAADLFEIPKDYKETSMTGEDEDEGKGEGDDASDGKKTRKGDAPPAGLPNFLKMLNK